MEKRENPLSMQKQKKELEVNPRGVEPLSSEPESDILSIELRVHVADRVREDSKND